MAMKGYSSFPKASALLKPHHQIVLSVMSRTLVAGDLPLCRDAVGVFCSPSRLNHQDTHWWSLSPLQKCSWCLLQPQPTRPPWYTLVESFSPTDMQLVSSAAPADSTTRIHIGGVFLLCRCSWYLLQPQPTRPPGYTLMESFSSAEMQSVYSAAPTDWTTSTLIGGDLPFSRDAVGVFYNPSWLGHVISGNYLS